METKEELSIIAVAVTLLLTPVMIIFLTGSILSIVERLIRSS